MPEMTGIEFLKTLSNPPCVIFTTAYDRYALEGFELSVVDYLLKPFSFYRFQQAVNKAIELIELRNRAIPALQSTVTQNDPSQLEFLKSLTSNFHSNLGPSMRL